MKKFLIYLALLPLNLAVAEEKSFKAVHKYTTHAVNSYVPFEGKSLMQEIAFATVESDNKEWNGSKIVDYLQYDSFNNKGTHVAYAVETHPNGDRTYWRFEGDHQIDDKGTGTSSGRGTSVGGTGKYKKFTAAVSYKCEGTAELTICYLDGKINY